METTRYITSAFEQPGNGAAGQMVVLEFNTNGESLHVRAGDDRWAMRAIEARRSFVSVEGRAEPVTHVRAIVGGAQRPARSRAICKEVADSGRAEAESSGEPVERLYRETAVTLVVNCGATPPLLAIQTNSEPGRRTFAITHHQQDAILDLLGRHVRAVGLPDLPAWPSGGDVKHAA